MSDNTEQSEEMSLTGKPKHLPLKSSTVTGWKRVDVGQKDPAVVTGDRPLDDLLKKYIGTHTELILPQGEYIVKNPCEFRDFDKLAIRGRPHATIKFVNDIKEGFVLGATYDTKPKEAPSQLEVENITFDVSKDGVGPVVLKGRVSDRLYVNNVDVQGRINSPTIRKLGTMLFAVTSWSGEGYVNAKMPDGAAFRPDEFPDKSPAEAQIDHPIGFNSPPDHRGHITYDNCRAEDFPNNGFYLTGCPGSFTVRRCTAKNNGNGNIRVGSDDVVEDSHALLDNMSSRGLTGCGMWLAHNGAQIRGGKIVCKDTDNDGLRVSADGRVRDLRIENECPIKAIDFPRDEPKDVVIEGLTLVDTADASGPAFAWEMDSHGVTLRDCTVTIEDEDRRGIYTGGESVTIDNLHGHTEGPGEIVAVDGPNTTLSNCRLTGNFVLRDGGHNGYYMGGCRHSGQVTGLNVNDFERDNLFD